jgi:hypothetical protein
MVPPYVLQTLPPPPLVGQRVHCETRGMEPNARTDYITTPNHIHTVVDNGVQLSTPAQTNAKKCFPHYLKMEQQITKGRVQGRGK